MERLAVNLFWKTLYLRCLTRFWIRFWFLLALLSLLLSLILPPPSPLHRQPRIGVLKKRYSEIMQQIYRRTLMSNCDFNKVAKQLYLNNTSTWVFSCKFSAYNFQIPFLKNTSRGLLLPLLLLLLQQRLLLKMTTLFCFSILLFALRYLE